MLGCLGLAVRSSGLALCHQSAPEGKCQCDHTGDDKTHVAESVTVGGLAILTGTQPFPFQRCCDASADDGRNGSGDQDGNDGEPKPMMLLPDAYNKFCHTVTPNVQDVMDSGRSRNDGWGSGGDVHFEEVSGLVFLREVAFDSGAVVAKGLEVSDGEVNGVEAAEGVEVVAGPDGFVGEIGGGVGRGSHGRILAWWVRQARCGGGPSTSSRELVGVRWFDKLTMSGGDVP